MIALESIRIDQAEGRADRMISGDFASFEAANAALRETSRQARPGRGYLKTDVVIRWADGTEHGFRCDIDADYTDTNLTALLLDWARRYRPGQVDGRDTQMNLKHLLSPAEVIEWEQQATRILDGDLQIG